MIRSDLLRRFAKTAVQCHIDDASRVLILHDGQFFFARIIDFRTTLENRLRRVR